MNTGAQQELILQCEGGSGIPVVTVIMHVQQQQPWGHISVFDVDTITRAGHVFGVSYVYCPACVYNLFLHASTGWWGKTCRSLKCLCNFIRLIQHNKCKPSVPMCSCIVYVLQHSTSYWTGRYLILQNEKHTAKSKNKKRTRPSQQTSQQFRGKLRN